MNKIVKKVSRDIPSLKFNTAIAGLMEWLNFLSKKKSITELEYKNLLKILAPFAPFMTEEIWRNVLGEKTSIHLSQWPKVDEKALIEEAVKIPVQVNGKVRAVISVSVDRLSEKEVVEKALKEEKVKKYLAGKKYKVIYIKGKILNLVLI